MMDDAQLIIFFTENYGHGDLTFDYPSMVRALRAVIAANAPKAAENAE